MAHAMPQQAEHLLTDVPHRANRLCRQLGRSQRGRLDATGRVAEPFEVVGWASNGNGFLRPVDPLTPFLNSKSAQVPFPKTPLDKPRSDVL
ncbi:MAG: hypothetical protein ABDI19_01960 [Armatimonadota bacterium]